MKKLGLYVVLAILVLLAVSVFTACIFSPTSSSTNNNDDSQQEEIKTTSITIFDGEYSKEFTVKNGKQVNIDALYGRDKYLKGYYNAEEGGTRYFDSMGKSTVVWSADLPNVFYAQWGKIEEIDAQTVQYFTDTPNTRSDTILTIDLSPELYNAVKGNLDSTLKIDMQFSRYHSRGGNIVVELRDTFEEGDELFYSGKFAGNEGNGSYKDYSISVDVTAECGRAGGIYIKIHDEQFLPGYSSVATKDMTVTISIL